MKIGPGELQVSEGNKVNLQDWPTLLKPACKSKRD